MNRRASRLIIGQAVSLGLLGAMLVIPGSAAFLDTFGAERLPYVYLLVAGGGALISWQLTSLQKNFGLFPLAIGTMSLIAIAAAGGWLLLIEGEADWVAFGILVLFSLQLQFGFVFIGAQAGRAFDVQEIKRVFPRIVAGFVGGFMVGGLAGGPLIDLFGDSRHLLALAALAAASMAVLMMRASTVVPSPDPEPAGHASAAEPISLRRLLAVPLVGAVFTYQLLSAMGTQLVEYLLYDSAAERYDSTDELASFMSGYTAILNLTDLVVLVALGGVLMSRYGLRFGVAANPLIITVLVAVAAVVAITVGPSSTTFFLLVAGARITDITMADAATRTSVNASFQALPPAQRLSAQVGVEGAGVPIALGLTAGLILILNALSGDSVTVVVLATLLLCCLWSGAAFVVYRRYRDAVVIAARRRTLDGDDVDLSESVTRDALVRLAKSGDARDVKVATDLLSRVNDSEVDQLLARAARGPSLATKAIVLPRLVELDPGLAREVALECLATGDEECGIAAIRALGELGGEQDLERIGDAVDRSSSLRRAGAAAFLARDRDPFGPDAIARSARSDVVEDRLFAARVLGEAALLPDAGVLLSLLDDDDLLVRREAAAAVAVLPEDDRRRLLGTLDSSDASPLIWRRFLRACRGRVGREFADDLMARVESGTDDADDIVRLLRSAGWRADERWQPVLFESVDSEVANIRSTRALLGDLGGGEQHERLRSALDAEVALAQRHLLELLGLLYDPDLITRVGRTLRSELDSDSGIALESLDVTLDPAHRSDVMAALSGSTATSDDARSAGDAVAALLRPEDWIRHRDWMQACAVAAAEADDAISDLVACGPVSAELLADTKLRRDQRGA